jgi:hypothetical protein
MSEQLSDETRLEKALDAMQAHVNMRLLAFRAYRLAGIKHALSMVKAWSGQNG